MNWKAVDSNARCDKTRQNSFFFPNEKERKLCKKKRRRGERGEGGRCLTFFKGIINSLRTLVAAVKIKENLFLQKSKTLSEFVLSSVVEEVVGRRHSLQGIRLDVDVYYEGLGVIPPGHDTSSPAAWIPSRIEIKQLNEKVMICTNCR